jgi:hypothetical protein
MQQVERAFAATFGDIADKAQDSAERIAGAFKLNLSDVQERMAKTQRTLEGLNFQPDTALAMNEQLERMSLDLASLWGLRPEEVSQRLTMGLMGATRGLRSLGIAIDENALKQVALKYHIGNTGEAFSRQQRSMLTYLAILDRSGKAAGDFANNLDSGANRLYLYKQALDDLVEALGVRLMPIMTAVLKASTGLMGKLTGLVGVWGMIPGPVRTATGAVLLFIGAMAGVRIASAGLLLIAPAFAIIPVAIGAVSMAIRTVTADFAVAAIVGKAGFTGLAFAGSVFRGVLLSLAPLASPVVVLTAAMWGLYSVYRLMKDVRAADASGRPTLAQSIMGQQATMSAGVTRNLGRSPGAGVSPFRPLTEAEQSLAAAQAMADRFRAIFAGAGTGINKASEALARWNALLQRGTALTVDALTPHQRYVRSMTELDVLLASGAIKSETYQSSSARLVGEFQAATAAAEGETRAVNALWDAMERPRVDLSGITLPDMSGLVDALSVPLDAMLAKVMDFAPMLNQAMADLFVGMADAAGRALGSGGNVLKAVGASFLSVLGGIMKQVGQAMIAFGVGLKALRTAIATMNPILAIGAGIALVVLGSALQGAMSNAASQVGGGGASGGGLGGGYYGGTSGQGQGQGTLTIVFPARGVFDPSDPQTMDAFVNMMEQASGRNVIVQRRA